MGDAAFTKDYGKGARPRLDGLYEKAKDAQWNGQRDLDWSIDVDPEQVAVANGADRAPRDDRVLVGTALEAWGPEQFLRLGVEIQRWMLSQFMHGEQGALVCAAKIVETVPWIDAKYVAATQVMDEARHLEVFSRYLDEKLSGHYPMNPHLKVLLDDIAADPRWDMTYLGMQVMVEGLALAAFGLIHSITSEPLLKSLLRSVMADEARHVAFGVISLQEHYAGLGEAELRERQEFALESALLMKDRMVMHEVWERMEVPPDDAARIMRASSEQQEFEVLLFSRIVPNLKKLGLLDAAGGWLRERFGEMGVVGFEDHDDPAAEVDSSHRTPAERRVA